MRSTIAVIWVSLSFLLTAAGSASAASGPLPGKTYFSNVPNVAITMSKSPTEISMLYASCSVGGQLKQSWSAYNVPLKRGGFWIDKKEKINDPSGSYTGTLLFTGIFTHGVFKGTLDIGGSSCPKASYTTKIAKGGGAES